MISKTELFNASKMNPEPFAITNSSTLTNEVIFLQGNFFKCIFEGYFISSNQLTVTLWEQNEHIISHITFKGKGTRWCQHYTKG